MAVIKKGTRKDVYLWVETLIERNSKKFDLEYGPKEHALEAGIYQCALCGRYIFHKGDSYFPPKDKDDDPHLWKLLISFDDPYPLENADF